MIAPGSCTGPKPGASATLRARPKHSSRPAVRVHSRSDSYASQRWRPPLVGGRTPAHPQPPSGLARTVAAAIVAGYHPFTISALVWAHGANPRHPLPALPPSQRPCALSETRAATWLECGPDSGPCRRWRSVVRRGVSRHDARWYDKLDVAAVSLGFARKRAPQGGDYWSRCDAARAAGTAPIYLGEPGYREGLDGDGDGVACEPYH
ncbi:MAG: excalibur calcium-binding domain-containing protein [Novosphingobium sp.]|uniref:excalibur calcium-binding domain-containing protein n=1 Tax=Novosphingobium sp. TaxID=1874826 RepID=UPI0027373E84|nr:excalibur calcium-binding domain-containing protein [Novosphingobium sp.]MDP3549329.1 excalibur calcium-binding domain-containing protein [Novosphingobium sp.]